MPLIYIYIYIYIFISLPFPPVTIPIPAILIYLQSGSEEVLLNLGGELLIHMKALSRMEINL